MAKTAKAKAGPKKKKKEAPMSSRALVPAKPNKTKRSSNGGGIDSLSKLLEHPLIAELISVGAIAAVAAIADHNVKTRTGEGQKGSKKALKAAGTAAASAIGKRLMGEVDEIKKASKKASR